MLNLGINWARAIPIHIVMDLGLKGNSPSQQPTLYGAEKACYAAYESDRFVGDVQRGGTCNFGDVKINPHLNGTHTECSGHITFQRRYITDIDTLSPKVAVLITLAPTKLAETGDSYGGKHSAEDVVISSASINAALEKSEAEKVVNLNAIVIRLMPNELSKKSRDYSGLVPPYFTSEAIAVIHKFGFQHLLTDLPSVDRTDDGGSLDNHHRFFGHTRGNEQAPRYKDNTITELIFVPDEVTDGAYAMVMNVAQWELDAAPSYPVLFPIGKKG